MIRIINGTYGYRNPKTNLVEAKTAKSAPFSLSPEREKELVETGVAEYADESAKEARKMKAAGTEQPAEEQSDEAPEYGRFKSKEQNIKAAEYYGVDVDESMKRDEIVDAIEEKLAEDLPDLKPEMPV